MSEKEKSGEDLIEKAEETASQEQVESKEEVPSFDPKAFADNETSAKTESKEEVKEEPQEESEESEENEEDDFVWGSVEQEQQEVKEEDEDWDPAPKQEEKKESIEEAVYDWEALGKEFGVSAKNEQEFKQAINKALKTPAPVNDTIQNLQDYLKLTDKSLVKSDLEASGLQKEEVEDTIGRLQDAGLLKREAIMIRKNLQNYISNEREKLRKTQTRRKQEEEQVNLNTRKSLQKYIKSKEDFFGGKVKTKDKKELYNYITSGNFAEEVYSDVANVADAAFLWKYKDKIFKMLRGQGMEKGKASVLNKITNPDLGRRSQHVDVKKKSGFDPVEFMK
tara:strand:- start:2543 stop:3550 length:1008 start_codon:yes stop_codon:yes gene_type:complete